MAPLFIILIYYPILQYVLHSTYMYMYIVHICTCTLCIFNSSYIEIVEKADDKASDQINLISTISNTR